MQQLSAIESESGSGSELKVATHIVAIGTSAGGLEALERLFRTLPANTGMAFIVVQHMSLEFKSMMPELLRRYTLMRVQAATGSTQLQPNVVFVVVPGKELSIKGEHLIVSDRDASELLHLPINRTFESLAALGPRAAAVVLSGTGSDGTTGAVSVREAGGLVVAQTPGTARFDGMPRALIESRAVDVVADPEEIPAVLMEWVRDPEGVRRLPYRTKLLEKPPGDGYGEGEGGTYGPILMRLKAAYDIDFQDYKQGTIERRIERRLTSGAVQVSVEDYAQTLSQSRAELDVLFADLLIGVTQFFRDDGAFRTLYEDLLSTQVSRLNPEEDLRIWCCACSTGEEAYTLAMLALEAFTQNGMSPRVRVLATDVHTTSLQFASVGVYAAEKVERVPKAMRERYFVSQPGGGFKVSSELRRCVVFSPHNVLRDAAFTRMHAVTCRNLLIYFQPHAQTRAIAAFHTAMLPGAALMLGESEGVGELADQFKEIDRGARIYVKRPDSVLPAHVRAMIATPAVSRMQMPGGSGSLEQRSVGRIYEQLLNRYAPTGLLINGNGELMHVFGDAGRYLQPSLGRFRSDLSGLLTGALKTTVFIALRRARESDSTVMFRDVPHASPDGEIMLSVAVDPFEDRGTGVTSFMVRLLEQRPEAEAPGPLVAAGVPLVDATAEQHIQDLEAELQLARESLQHTVEELEAANEELQAGNEELMAANEELQSTNEELHAVNEELFTVNAEHEIKIRELHDITADLNNLIRAADLATVFVDAAGRIRLFTPAAMALFPIQQSDIGRDLHDFMPRVSDPTLFDDLADVIPHPRTIEAEIRLDDGRVMRRRVTPYRDADNRISGAVLTYLDLSDQTRVREMLRDSQEEMRVFLESAPVLAWTANSQGELERASAHWMQYCGATADVLRGDGWRSMIHPDDAGAMVLAWRRAIGTAGAFRHSARIRRRDGVYRWFELHALPVTGRDGEVQQWHGSCVDVHELHEANRDLARALEVGRGELQQLRAAIEAMPTGFLLTDLDGRVLHANPSAAGLLAASLDELVGAPIEAFIPEGLNAEIGGVRGALSRAPTDASAIAVLPCPEVRTLDGAMVPADVRLAPVSQGGSGLVVVSIRDDSMARQMQVSAESAARAKSAFLATMSHEIRTPLNAILGMAQLMRHEEPTPKQADRLIRIEEASNHLLSIINDVLDLSKVEAGKLTIDTEPFEVAAVLGDAVRMVESAAKAKGLELGVDIAAGVPTWVRCDPRRVTQILVNYLNNALKFTPSGSIRVKVRATGRSRGELQLRFEVRDTGIGIPRDQQAKLFTPFQQVDGSLRRSVGGTGLGLAICRELARAMRGEVGVESDVGAGSTFWFTVRVSRAGPSHSDRTNLVPSQVSAEDLRRRLAHRNILLVEDDPVNQIVATEMIQAVTGLEPEFVASGPEALERAAQVRFDLVFMDIQLPGMDGIETTRELRQTEGYADVPIIALTANAFDDDIKRCHDAGMDDHLSKPLLEPALRRIFITWLASDGPVSRW